MLNFWRMHPGASSTTPQQEVRTIEEDRNFEVCKAKRDVWLYPGDQCFQLAMWLDHYTFDFSNHN